MENNVFVYDTPEKNPAAGSAATPIRTRTTSCLRCSNSVAAHATGMRYDVATVRANCSITPPSTRTR
jgi:hypothetical protein